MKILRKIIPKDKPKFYIFWMMKAWFDEGYGFTGIIAKPFFLVFTVQEAVRTESYFWTLVFGMGYGIFCFLLGMWIYLSGQKASQFEIQNKVNPFVTGLRKNLNIQAPLEKDDDVH